MTRWDSGADGRSGVSELPISAATKALQVLRTALVAAVGLAAIALVTLTSMPHAGAGRAISHATVQSCSRIGTLPDAGESGSSRNDTPIARSFLTQLEVINGHSTVTVATTQEWPASVAQVGITISESSTDSTGKHYELTKKDSAGTVTGCTVPGIKAGMTFHLRLQALDASGAVMSSYAAPDVMSVQIPLRPTRVTVEQTGSKGATVSWTGNAPFVNIWATHSGKTVGSEVCPHRATQCSIAPLEINKTYTFYVQLANSDPQSLRGAVCPQSVCSQNQKPEPQVLHNRFWRPTKVVTKTSYTLSIIFLVLGLLAGGLAGYLLASRRQRKHLMPGQPVWGGSSLGGSVPDSAPAVGPSELRPPPPPPVIVRNLSGPTTPVHIAFADRNFPGGTGVVMAAADPVGFAEFADGITRRVEVLDGVAVAPGSTVEDIRRTVVPRGARRR